MIKDSFPMPGMYWFWQAVLYVMFVVFMLGWMPMAVAQQPWALAYTDFMAAWVPMLNQVHKIPGFNPYLKFYYAAMWMVVPLLAMGPVALAMFHPAVKQTRNLRLSGSLGHLLPYFAAATFFVLVTLLWPVHAGQRSWRDQSLVQNAFGIGWFGMVTAWMWTIWFAYLFSFFERLFCFFNRHKHKLLGVNHG